ncbi:MAG: protein-export chaperone SecB, partial [Pseudomonadota bacterium]
MSETSSQPPASEATAPVMRLLTQYLKDLSFESPAAPQSLRGDLKAPELEVGVDLNARKLSEEQYEVELACSATAKRDGDVVFVVETNYAGLFLLQNLPREQLEPALLIEGPRLLFPFARQIIAEATQNGGFSPLMLEPIDFASMYRMQLNQRQQQQEA